MLESVAKTESVQAKLHAVLTFVLIADDHVLIPVIVWSALAIHRLQMVLVVTDVEASTLPFMRLVNLVLLVGVDERFHAN